MRLNDALEFGFDHVAVKIKIDDFRRVDGPYARHICAANLHRGHGVAGGACRTTALSASGGSVLHGHVIEFDIRAASRHRGSKNEGEKEGRKNALHEVPPVS